MPEMDFAEYLALNERIQATKHAEPGSEPLDALIVDLNQSTSDGTPITLGLRVTDYNRNRTFVTGIQSLDYLTGLVWFTTANGGMFDGSRLEAIRRG